MWFVDCSCIQVIADEVLVLSILKFDSSVNQLSATFAGVRDGEGFCKRWFEHRCRVESHSEDGKLVISRCVGYTLNIVHAMHKYSCMSISVTDHAYYHRCYTAHQLNLIIISFYFSNFQICLILARKTCLTTQPLIRQ